MLIKVKLLSPLDFLLGVVQPLLNHFFGLSSTLIEPFLKYSQAGSVNEKEVAVDLVVVDLLTALDIDIKKANLYPINHTFPRFMMSMSLPL
jgi:hypothetical protein